MKMLKVSIIVATFLAASVLHYGDGSRILGIFPTASISHQVVFRGLTLALNKRGHELVIVTTDPVNDLALKNYREIDISFLYNIPYVVNFITNRAKVYELASFFSTILPAVERQTEQILSLPEFKKLYEPNSNEKFDLILMEMLMWPAFLPLAKRFDAPIVGMTSMGLPINIEYTIGNPIMPSHPSTWQIHAKDFASSTFWQRLCNFIDVWRYIYHYRTGHIPRQEAIAKKYFGMDTLNLEEIEKNVSLIFVNQQGPISYVKPNVPKLIEIGGFHVSKQIETLPKDLQKHLDEATQGFIYMSLGSNVKSNMLSPDTLRDFAAAFSKLPYQVIWKFEGDAFPGKPENVMIMKWTPQQAILAHPNLRAFIYQGGLQSTEEAISHAVPLIGLPVVGDQDMLVNKMVSLGVAMKLEITSVNRSNILQTIRAVTLDDGYKQRMLNLRSIVNDKPHDPLQYAVWWTEFVIRHRGAPHLHSSTADKQWFRRSDMDIVAFITAVVVVAFIISTIILHQSLAFSIATFINSSVKTKQKKN